MGFLVHENSQPPKVILDFSAREVRPGDCLVTTDQNGSTRRFYPRIFGIEEWRLSPEGELQSWGYHGAYRQPRLLELPENGILIEGYRESGYEPPAGY